MLRLSHGRARHPSVAIVQTSHSALHRRHRRHHVAHEARPDNIRHDPGLGADTQVHVLVGFIGGYFVFKNISQLILYQRALRGNTELDNDLESKVSTKLDLQSKVLKAAGIMVKVVSAVESAATGLPVNDPETVGDDPKTVSSSGQDEKSKEKTADTRLLMPRLG